jgi:hypothetical protein
MKKFAILAVVLTFAGVVMAGCPAANNAGNKAAPTNGTTAPANNG